MTDKAARRYLAGVRRALPWDGSRAPLTEKAAALVAEYLEENPNAQGADLAAAFGAPADFAAEMVGPEGITRGKKQRRLAVGCGIAAVLLVLAVVASVFFVRWQRLRAIIPEDGNFDIIYPAKTLTPEEFEEIWNDPNVIKDGE